MGVSGGALTMLELAKVATPEEARARERLSQEAIVEYAGVLEEGGELPPITVYRVGRTYVVADGWHRLAAHKLAKRKYIACVVKEGTLRDAQLAAAASNARRGVKRTNGDCRRAVWLVLQGVEGKTWGVSKIAEHCGVSPTMVRAMQRAAACAPERGEEVIGQGPAAVTGEVRAAPDTAWGRAEPAPLVQIACVVAGPEALAAPGRGALLPAPAAAQSATSVCEPCSPAPVVADDGDRAVVQERTWRLLRKFFRYARALGREPEELLREFRQRRAAAGEGGA